MTSSDILKILKDKGNREYAEHSSRFFKTEKGEYGEGDLFLGIRVPEIRKAVSKFRDTPLEEIKILLSSPFHEVRLFGFLSLAYRYKRGKEPDRKLLFDTYIENKRFVNNWDIVDTTAPNIVGEHLVNRDKKLLYDLAVSPVLWDRRIAVISTFTFIKAGNFTDTLNISEILLKSPEDLIHKAVGWMLREVGNRDMEAEELFLKKHYGKMPRTMLRYAIEKFEEGKRQAYLKAEI